MTWRGVNKGPGGSIDLGMSPICIVDGSKSKKLEKTKLIGQSILEIGLLHGFL